MNKAIMEIESVYKKFGGLEALSNISFKVEEGSISSLIGPNGSGKTTLFNVITNHIPLNSGKVLYQGERIDHLPAYLIPRKGIARTFQIISLFPQVSVFENVACGAFSNTKAGALSIIFRSRWARLEEKGIRERTMDAIRQNGLEQWTNIPAGALPFGQQRLVEFARAIVSDPKLLLLDEPLSGLTFKESDILQQKILEIRDRGVTVLFVEHEMKAVMKISDKVTVLNFGKKIAEGSPNEIRSNAAVIEAYLGGEC